MRLISKGLGEAAIALAAGFAIPAVGYLSVMGQFDLLFAYFVLPFMLYGFMLSLSLEAPDIEVDLKTGKRNIGVRKGEKTVVGLILAVTSIASLFFVCAGQINIASINLGVVMLFSTVPLAAGVTGFFSLLQKKPMRRYYTANILALFFFNAVMVAYLLAIVAAK